jgi:8-oxo-dGTP pyrophosphatase MutT (NUDIX family)
MDVGLEGLAQIEQVRAVVVRPLSRHGDYHFLSIFKEQANGECYWEIPKGRVETERGETARKALFREISEEVGLEKGQLKLLNRNPVTLPPFESVRDGVSVETYARVYAVAVIDPKAKITIGRSENHIRYEWGSYAATMIRLLHPQYTQQREGFIRACEANKLVPQRRDEYSSSFKMARPTIAQIAAVGYNRR